MENEKRKKTMERPNISVILTLGHKIRLLLLLFSVLCFIAFIFPNMSGAWDLAKKQDGITVYTRSVKGSGFKEYKAIANIRASLSSMVAIVEDIEAYPSWIHTCKEGKLLKRINEKETYNYTINDAPWPVKDRDAAVHNKISQNPEDRVVTIEIKGIPDYIPEKPGLQRVKKIDGFWRFTPLGNDTVEVVYQVHSEPGGNLPSWLVNSIVVDQPFYTLVNMQKMVTQPKYRQATYKFIKE
jgi:ribosome-associated toxin RatA of RatAB toxin-antitoxin module